MRRSTVLEAEVAAEVPVIDVPPPSFEIAAGAAGDVPAPDAVAEPTEVPQEFIELRAWAAENPGIVIDFDGTRLIADPTFNGRVVPVKATDKDVKALAASIATQGQRQAAQGYFNAAGLPALAFGFRRREAAIIAGVPLRIIFDAEMTEEQAFELNVGENTQRRDLRTIDLIRDVERLSVSGKKGIEIATITGLSNASISLYKSLSKRAETHPTLLELIEQDVLTRTQALELLAIKDDKELATALKEITDAATEAQKSGATASATRKATGKKVAAATGKAVKSAATSKRTAKQAAALLADAVKDHKDNARLKAILAAQRTFTLGTMRIEKLIEVIVEHLKR